MVNKNFIFLLLGLLLLTSFASAWDWDNVVIEISENPNTGYPNLEIKNALGFGETLFEGSLTEHTPTCGEECMSKLEFNHAGGVLIDDIRFLTLRDEGWVKQDIRSYKIKYEAELPEYETECEETGEYTINGTAIIECNQVQTGTYTGWKYYYVGEELPEGHYEMFLEGKKKPSRTVDWQFKIQGKWLEEWAVWGSIGGGDDAEVILNSPADSSTTLSNPVTFNASANVTNGATIVNMSVCTNETGSWVCGYNSTNTLGSRTYEDLNSTLKTNLESYWKLDESSGAVLDADSGDDGTNQGATANADGMSNTAYTFSGGASRIEMDTENRLRGTSGITSGSLWMKGTSPDTYVISKGNGYQDGEADHWALYVNTAGLLGLQTLNNDNKQEIISSSNVSDGDWHHIYFQFGTSGMMLYIDGVSENPDGGKTQQSGLDASDLKPFAIGSNFRATHGVWMTGFVGTIDEVAVWSRALNTDEISFLAEQAPTTYTHTFNRTIDDSIIWNVQACDSDGDCGFAASNYNLFVDTTAPSVSIDYPATVFDSLADGESVDLNTTITDTNLESCWYEYNGVNTTIPSCGDYSFTYALGVDTITVHANDSVGNMGSDTVSWVIKIRADTLLYNNETRAGDQEDFSLVVTVGEGYEITSATFHYNDYSFTPEIYTSGDQRILNITSYTIPPYTVSTNVTIYYEIVLDDATELNTTDYIQLVQPIYLDNCSVYTNTLFNMTLFDEVSLEEIRGDIEFYYSLLNIPAYDVINSINLSFTNVSNAVVCSGLNLTGENYVQSIEIRYTSEDYAPELYHIQRAEISPEITNIGLYDLPLNSSTEFKVTYQDDTFNFVEGAVLQLRRRYISENLYRVVEAPLTSNEGVAVVHVDLDTVKYGATIVKNGEVLDTFNNIVFKCENELSGECEQKLLGEINPQNTIDYDTQRDFSYTIVPGNNNITVIYSIPSSLPSDINIGLTQKDQFGNESICDKTIVSSGGSIQCTYDDTLGTSYLELQIYKDGEIVGYNTYVIEEETGSDFLDNNYIIVVVLVLSIVGMGISSPEWIVINGLITLLLSGMLWLINGINFVAGLGLLMWLVIAVGILILKFSKQEDR